MGRLGPMNQSIIRIASYGGRQTAPHRGFGIPADVGKQLAVDGTSSDFRKMERFLRVAKDLDRSFEEGHENLGEKG